MLRVLILVTVLSIGGYFLFFQSNFNSQQITSPIKETTHHLASLLPIPTSPPNSSTIDLTNLPSEKTLQNNYHTFQTFNNCGPAALSMALSYYGIKESQQTLGNKLRPYQIPNGNNDDKSVTLEELAEIAKEYDLIPYHRPNGSIALIKQFIASDIPVLTRTWLKLDEDIGHYRVVKGYNETTQELIQDDSLQGKNLRYSYNNFLGLWDKFNYEYLVLVPKDKQSIVETILGEQKDQKIAWQKAVQLSTQALQKKPDDLTQRFNLSVAFYMVGKYQESVTEYEKVEGKLPFRTLWYQIEPIKAYYKIGNSQKAQAISESILNNHNRAYSELYYLRAEHLQKNGQPEAAEQEFAKAKQYNQNNYYLVNLE